MKTAPVIQTSVQLSLGPSTAAAAGTPANAGGAQSAFAGVLNAAGAKPSRRPGSSKQSEDGASGAGLPPAGNQSPLPPLPQAAATAVATPHISSSAPADRPRLMGRASGGASADNPLAVQAAGVAQAAAAAAMIEGAKSPATIAGGAAVTRAAADVAKPKAPPPFVSLQSNPALTPDSATPPNRATAVDRSAAAALAPATPALEASAGQTPPTAPSAAADQAAVKPQPSALRPVAKATARTAAPASDSAKAPAAGGEADSTLRPAAASASDSSATSSAAVPVPVTTGTGAQDVAATIAAAGAAVAGTPQPTSTAKATSDNSYDSDASVGALGAATDAAAAPAPPGQAALRAAAGPLPAPAVASALLVAADKHAHAGFDLAALTGGTGDAAAGLSQLNASAAVNAPADATPAPALQIHASVDSADFSQGLSDRVSWMVDNGVNGAKLQVNPPQLGPIELRISVQGDHAQVWMTTHSAVARDALDASSPKLREMLNNQGFSQVSVDISQRSFQDRSAYTPPYQREPADVRGAAATPTATVTAASRSRTAAGALDAYA